MRVYSMTIPYRTAKFKSANVFILAALDHTAKFKDRQYFRLYGLYKSLLHVHVTTSLHPSLPAGPMITTGPVDQTLNAEMVLELNCTAVNNDGATQPLVIMWMFTPSGLGAPVYYAVADPEVTQTVDNDTVTSVLRINSVASTNSGMYGCHAYNRNLQDAVVENATVTVFCELRKCTHTMYMYVHVHCMCMYIVCACTCMCMDMWLYTQMYT